MDSRLLEKFISYQITFTFGSHIGVNKQDTLRILSYLMAYFKLYEFYGNLSFFMGVIHWHLQVSPYGLI